MLDLDYPEDSNAEADANFVLTGDGKLAEVQATAEGATFDEEELLRLLRLARIGCSQIFAAQDAARLGATGPVSGEGDSRQAIRKLDRRQAGHRQP